MPQTAAKENRTLVLTNGLAYSAGFPEPRPATVVVRHGHIAFLGSEADARSLHPSCDDVLDCSGRLIMPGFIDTHIHPLIGIEDLIDCSLADLDTLDACLDRVRSYAATSSRTFVRGNGWAYGLFPAGAPHKSLLDAIVPDQPVFLKAVDGHSAWVNSKALEFAGITASTPDPESGKIERDPKTGEPTGVLREWPAMGLVFGLLPKIGTDELKEGFRTFLSMAARFGITAIHDARAKERFMSIYTEFADRGELSVRLRTSLFCDPKLGPEQVAGLEEMRRHFLRPGLRCSSVKVFLDGVVEGRTAFLVDPYADQPQTLEKPDPQDVGSGPPASGWRNSGEPIWNPDHLMQVAAAVDKAGWQMHFHAVGDGAVRLALDSIKHAFEVNGRRDARHMIAHCDLINPADLDRFGQTGSIANYSPSWFYRDRNFSDITLPQLGAERANRLYAIRDLLDHGGGVACSSDWPFGGDYLTFNPLDGIQTAVTRKGVKAQDREELCPKQRVDLKTMIDAYTLGSAHAEFLDDQVGTLEAGKKADLIILDRNIFQEPVSRISQARVLHTMVDGLTVWSDW